MSSSGGENVSDMTHTAHAYVTSVNILVLMPAYAYACAYGFN